MTDFTKQKEALEKEMKELNTELSRLGIENPNDPAGWTLKNPAIDVMQADKNEAADKNEEFHVNSIILDELAVRYKNVERALKKLEEGTYGTCEVDGKVIEEDRLRANPAARTCKEHITETEKLDD
jgi:RNA polymerase-binding transcription factor DksA